MSISYLIRSIIIANDANNQDIVTHTCTYTCIITYDTSVTNTDNDTVNWVNRKDGLQITEYGSELTLISARSCDVR